jgi:hypothetical protein
LPLPFGHHPLVSTRESPLSPQIHPPFIIFAGGQVRSKNGTFLYHKNSVVNRSTHCNSVRLSPLCRQELGHNNFGEAEGGNGGDLGMLDPVEAAALKVGWIRDFPFVGKGWVFAWFAVEVQPSCKLMQVQGRIRTWTTTRQKAPLTWHEGEKGSHITSPEMPIFVLSRRTATPASLAAVAEACHTQLSESLLSESFLFFMSGSLPTTPCCGKITPSSKRSLWYDPRRPLTSPS